MAQYEYGCGCGYGCQNESDTDSEAAFESDADDIEAFESDSDYDEAFEGAFTAKPPQQPPPQSIKPPPSKAVTQTPPPTKTQNGATKPKPGSQNPSSKNSSEIQNRKWRIKPTILDRENKLFTRVASDIAQLSNERLREKHSFIVAFSGGNFIHSLRTIFESPGHSTSVTWAKWHLFWVDDKIVSPDHSEGNYKIAYDPYLTKVSIPEENMYFIKHDSNPQNVANDYKSRMEALVDRKLLSLTKDGFPKFDLVVLGVGPEGNVGSLFPKGSECSDRKSWVVPVTRTTPQRITFTFPVINSASNIYVVGTGEAVADAVGKAFGATGRGETLPIQMISDEGNLTCFLDKAAASKIPKQ